MEASLNMVTSLSAISFIIDILCREGDSLCKITHSEKTYDHLMLSKGNDQRTQVRAVKFSLNKTALNFDWKKKNCVYAKTFSK